MKFLICLDGSNASRAALETGCKYANVFCADVVVFTSIEGEVMTRDKDIAKAEKSLEYSHEFLKDKGIAFETELSIRGFKPGEDVVNYARENNIEAIFIGIKRRSNFDKLVFGSNATYIIQNAPCPVTSVQ